MFKEDCEGAGGSGGNEIKWEEDVNSWEARKEANQSRIRREREKCLDITYCIFLLPFLKNTQGKQF